MESLLSLSFDYLSSYDGVKVRKGLRQLEGLLAQICLSRSAPAQDRRSSIAVTNGATKPGPKELGQLKEDPAFREFFKLQEGFEWNSPFAFHAFPQIQTMLIEMNNSRHASYPHARTASITVFDWRE